MEDLELAQELLNAKKNVVTEIQKVIIGQDEVIEDLLCLLYTSPSPRDGLLSRMPSSA